VQKKRYCLKMNGALFNYHHFALCFLFVVICANNVVSSKHPGSPLKSGNASDFASSKQVECSHIRHVNASFQCTFAQETEDCKYSSGFLQYVYIVYCDFSSHKPWILLLLAIVLIYLFIALGVTAEDFFCPCLKTFSKALHMSDSVAGVTLLALGNGAPDIFSVLAAITSGDEDTAPLAFQELFGAGIFVTTVVAGSIQLRCSFKLARRPFIRDLVFYISAVCWTFAVIYRKEIRTAEAVGFIVLYVIYVTLVVAGQAVNRTIRARTLTSSHYGSIINSDDKVVVPRNRRQRRAIIEDLQASADFTEFEPNYESPLIRNNYEQIPSSVVNEEAPALQRTEGDESEEIIKDESVLERIIGIEFSEWRKKAFVWKSFDIIKVPLNIFLNLTTPIIDIDCYNYKWNKFLIMLQCVVCPTTCSFVAEKAFVPVAWGLSVWELLLIVGSILAVLVMLTTTEQRPPKFYVVFAIAGFAASVIWIYALAQEIVNLLKTFGIVLGISNSILGLTLLAWGNSIGDFISNMAMAKNGAPRMAMAACYGGPLLNMVLGVGISCTVSALTHNGHVKLIRGHLQYIISASFLGASLLTALFFMPMLKFSTSKWIGFLLMALYFAYLAVSISNGAGVLTKIR